MSEVKQSRRLAYRNVTAPFLSSESNNLVMISGCWVFFFLPKGFRSADVIWQRFTQPGCKVKFTCSSAGRSCSFTTAGLSFLKDYRCNQQGKRKGFTAFSLKTLFGYLSYSNIIFQCSQVNFITLHKKLLPIYSRRPINT